MSARKTVVVRLTLPEARALSRAKDNTMIGDKQDLEALFSSESEISLAYRASEKLDNAIAKVGGFERAQKTRA